MNIKYLYSNKQERKELLLLPFEKRLEITKELIRESLSLAKNPVVQFSGGGDSCLMSYLIYKENPSVPQVFFDNGLLMKEHRQACIDFFNHYKMKYFIAESGTNYRDFIKKKGFPFFKALKGIVPKSEYKKLNISTSCRGLRKRCWRGFLKKFKCDYFFVGILATETPQRKSLFIQNGFVSKKKEGNYLVKPIALITKPEVFKLLKEYKIPYPTEYYEDCYKGKCSVKEDSHLDCFMCAYRMKEEGYGRLGWLARHRPEYLKELIDLGLSDVFKEICTKYPMKTGFIQDFLEEYCKVSCNFSKNIF